MFNNMQFFISLIFISILLFFIVLIGAQKCKTTGVVKTVVVDCSGNGDFQKVQDAIDSVPLQNSNWIKIQVSPGDYLEKVIIPANKGCILLEGAGINKTYIKWGDHAKTETSATFSSSSENVLVRGITFENTFRPKAGGYGLDITPAVAVEIQADKTAFFNCAFISVQDTVADMVGRHYFKNCYIEGAIDFIFGYAQSIYEDSEIVVNTGKYAPVGRIGTITAHGKQDVNSKGAFIFKNCTIDGVGKVFLGRSWKAYATVIFSQTKMADVIVPQGWDCWNGAGHESEIIFAEIGCTGPGAKTSNRVKWSKRHVNQEFISLTYIDQEGWIKELSELT